MARSIPLWKTRARSLEKAGKQFRQKSPDGIHDLRVALRRVSATASALGRDGLAKRSRKLVRSLSDLRQIEVDRRLLSRVKELGWLPETVAAGIDARWDSLLREGEKQAARRVPDERLDRLARKLSRLSKKKQRDLVVRLEDALRRAEEDVAALSAESNDRTLHRYRLAVKRARYLTEDLALAGRPGLEEEIERKKNIQDALGRWNDLRLFRQHLVATRDDAGRRGAVTLLLELDRLLAALQLAVESARREGLKVVGRQAGSEARGIPPAAKSLRPAPRSSSTAN